MLARIYLSLFLLLGLLPGITDAGDKGCHCGGCENVCKLVCTTRTIEETCYDCECEEICIPGPSRKCQKHYDSVGKCDLFCYLRWTEWQPGCAKIITRKKPTKYVVKKKVPWYEWVVVPACDCKSAADQPKDIVKATPEEATLGDRIPLTPDEKHSLETLLRTARSETVAPVIVEESRR